MALAMTGGQIINAHSNHALDTVDNEHVVQQEASSASETQRWSIVPSGQDSYRIEHVGSGRCLTAQANNWEVVLRPNMNIDTQRWKLINISGFYLIENLATQQVLDMPEWSTDPGRAVQQHSRTEENGRNQHWLLATLTDQASTPQTPTPAPAPRIFVGQTQPGQGWEQYHTDSATLRVDTSAANFSSTPVYVISVGGTGGHYAVTGDACVYYPARNQFQVYLRYPTTPFSLGDLARRNGWYVNWIGIELPA